MKTGKFLSSKKVQKKRREHCVLQNDTSINFTPVQGGAPVEVYKGSGVGTSDKKQPKTTFYKG